MVGGSAGCRATMCRIWSNGRGCKYVSQRLSVSLRSDTSVLILFARAATTASCAPQSSVQAIHFDGDRDVNALQGLPWAQFCDTDKCGIKAGALAVGCYNPTNAQSQPVQQPLLDKLDCPTDQVVEVIYAHWNELSIQSLDAVTCRRALLHDPYYFKNLSADCINSALQILPQNRAPIASSNSLSTCVELNDRVADFTSGWISTATCTVHLKLWERGIKLFLLQLCTQLWPPMTLYSPRGVSLVEKQQQQLISGAMAQHQMSVAA